MESYDHRIAELEKQVEEMRLDMEGMAHSIWSEAGTAKACQTAVAVLLSAMKVNPFVVQALRDSLDGAEQVHTMAWTPAPYAESFGRARQFILAEVGCPAEGGCPAGATLQ